MTAEELTEALEQLLSFDSTIEAIDEVYSGTANEIEITTTDGKKFVLRVEALA